ncbi:hypothetical protein ABZ722_11580 [Streptomyces longwoodensis]|uniref:hypothetical protein n=1 Tax=Streptomyces longwoodensis TaxID=68231 RepID=UPI0033C07783
MTHRRPGQWPIDHPADIPPAPAPSAPPRPAADLVDVPRPDVRLVVTVDLTADYDTPADVSRALFEQTRHASDCHTAIVRVGESAARPGTDLGKSIASAFYLSARHIEVHVPAGTRHAYLASEVARYVRLFHDDHVRMLQTLHNPG